MIEMEDIRKDFALGGKIFHVLKGINIHINKGEFVSIMGPSGSGKSTISSILGLLAKSTSGKYTLMGEEVSKMSSFSLAKFRNKTIGFIFQDFNLLYNISVLDNVRLPLFYAGVPNNLANKRALQSLKDVELSERAYYYPKQLSGGQKQRVAIARALVSKPSIIFADEPTGALDQKTGHNIMGILQKLNQEGQTIIQVTHSLLHSQYSKRILYLVDGLIVKDEVVQNQIIAKWSTNDNTASNLITSVWRIAKECKEKTKDNLKILVDLYDKRKDEIEYLNHAGSAFCQFKEKEAQDILLDLFQKDDPVIKSDIINNLKEHDINFCEKIYKMALTGQDKWNAFLALTKIEWLDSKEFSDEIKKLILEKIDSDDERIRSIFYNIVPKFDQSEEQFLKIMKKGTDDVDGRVRSNAIWSLGEMIKAKKINMSDDILEIFKKSLKDKNNRAQANAAVQIIPYDKDAAFKTFSLMITNENGLIRSSGSWGIKYLENEECGKQLINQLKVEKEEMVLNQIVRSLAYLSANVLSLEKQMAQIDQ